MLNIIKGIAIGVANIIPGVSGGTIAVVLGIYDKLIESISEFIPNKSKRKEYAIFITQIISGAAIGVLAFAKLLDYCLTNFHSITMIVFMGVILWGVPTVYKAHPDMKPTLKKSLVFLAAFFLMLIFALIPEKEATKEIATNISIGMIFYFLISGFIAAGTMVIPGISGSLMLLLIGSYGLILGAVSDFESNLLHLCSTPSYAPLIQNIVLLSAVGIGVLLGIWLFTKVIHKCLKACPSYTYYAILGLIIGSVIKIIVLIPKG